PWRGECEQAVSLGGNGFVEHVLDEFPKQRRELLLVEMDPRASGSRRRPLLREPLAGLPRRSHPHRGDRLGRSRLSGVSNPEPPNEPMLPLVGRLPARPIPAVARRVLGAGGPRLGANGTGGTDRLGSAHDVRSSGTEAFVRQAARSITLLP